MRRMILSLCLAALAWTPATAGPWPREEGRGFAALAAPSFAFAQEDGARPDITLRGDVRLPAAYDPIELGVPPMIAAPAGAVDRADLDAALRLGDAEGSASAMQWYERFTLAPTEPQILWGEGEAFRMQA
ncbi:hypothetical protein, partial [Rhodosalinus sp.]|uniref:hypothetical protein n=1 Tax=Rhodosalinus sp. TaxID=2047741 RepID=UPI00397DA43B